MHEGGEYHISERRRGTNSFTRQHLSHFQAYVSELLADLESVRDGKRRRATRQGEPGGETIIIGHSLGGAYASIVGSLAEVPTFLLSPPGLYYGVKKFGIDDTDQLYGSICSVVPDNDPVPKADFQVR